MARARRKKGLTDDEAKQPNRDGSLRVEAEQVALELDVQFPIRWRYASAARAIVTIQ
jgi:hypothetical protein